MSWSCRVKIPAPIKSSIAGMPGAVAGTLIMRLALFTARHSRLASATVPAVSWARWGDTSRLTKPSPPSDPSYTGRRTSEARRISSIASASYISSTVISGRRDSRASICPS